MKGELQLNLNQEGSNNTLYIYRGIAIFFMVLGHSGISQRAWGDQFFSLFLFLYLFHMSLFFFYSGFFFNMKSLDSPWKFFKRKLQTLYYPMLKWGVFFILLRNTLIPLHLSNQAPYTSWSEFWHRGFWSLLQFYDTEQMMGAFWFVRVLFFTNIIFFLLAYIAQPKFHGRRREMVAGGGVWTLGYGLCVLQILIFLNGAFHKPSFW